MMIKEWFKETFGKKEKLQLGRNYIMFYHKDKIQEIEDELDSLIVMSELIGYDVNYSLRCGVVDNRHYSLSISIDSENNHCTMTFHAKKYKLTNASLICTHHRGTPTITMNQSKNPIEIVQQVKSIMIGEKNSNGEGTSSVSCG